MFPEDPSQPEDPKLEALAAAMKDEAANPVSVDRDGGELKVDRGDNPRVPAGLLISASSSTTISRST